MIYRHLDSNAVLERSTIVLPRNVKIVRPAHTGYHLSITFLSIMMNIFITKYIFPAVKHAKRRKVTAFSDLSVIFQQSKRRRMHTLSNWVL